MGSMDSYGYYRFEANRPKHKNMNRYKDVILEKLFVAWCVKRFKKSEMTEYFILLVCNKAIAPPFANSCGICQHALKIAASTDCGVD